MGVHVVEYLPGKTLGEKGGQGAVRRGRGSDGSEVAMKFLLVDDNPSAKVLKERKERFRREVRVMQSLDHPGIMQVIAAELDLDEPYFVMPIADGGSLHRLIEAAASAPLGRLPEDEVEEIIDQVLDAVAYAHRKGVVHRDLKPMNVLIMGGRAMVSDFGMGRDLLGSSNLTKTHMGAGTPPYASPEQFQGGRLREAGKPSDVYSLAQLMYELLSGRAPHRVDPRRVPARYRAVIEKARSDEPEDRFPDAAEMLLEFRAARDMHVAGELEADVDELLIAIAAGEKEAPAVLFTKILSNPNSVAANRLLLRVPAPLLAKLVEASSIRMTSLVRQVLSVIAERGDPSDDTNLAFFAWNSGKLLRGTPVQVDCLGALLTLAAHKSLTYALDRLIGARVAAETDEAFLVALRTLWGTRQVDARKVAPVVHAGASERVLQVLTEALRG
jgi:eukaryotic-like serine/threonine-protein kinase